MIIDLFKCYMNSLLNVKKFIYDDSVKDFSVKWNINNFDELDEESIYSDIKALVQQWYN